MAWYFPAQGDSADGTPTDEYENDIHRLFDPDMSTMHCDVPESQLIAYNTTKQVSQLQLVHPRTNAIELDSFTLVVHIDGACRNNGTPAAEAGWGVYFGPGSRYNSYGKVEAHLPQTSSYAEIEALSKALDILADITKSDFSLQQIRIACDSEYLVKAMSIWIETWIENNGVSSAGRPVAHFDKLRQIHERMDEMEYGDDGGIETKFWSISRDKNTDANRLANMALDG